jgi:HPt (histidine-containing phosphotransfer) domain-containing protein
MDQILTKPFSEKELLDILLEVVASEPADKFSMQPPVNIGELNYLANGDRVFLCEMIELFITSTTSALDKIRNAIRDNDLKTVFENAHKIAAPCKQIQANRLYGFIKQLEVISRDGDNMEPVIALFQSVNAEMSEVREYLRQYKEEIKP